MACEASRRPREGSPLIPGSIWRFCSPSGFCLCHWGNCSPATHSCRYLLREFLRVEALLTLKQLQALALCEGRVSSSADHLQPAALQSAERRA